MAVEAVAVTAGCDVAVTEADNTVGDGVGTASA
jgi:hypothetical protein